MPSVPSPVMLLMVSVRVDVPEPVTATVPAADPVELRVTFPAARLSVRARVIDE
jgi:hypothetical protein